AIAAPRPSPSARTDKGRRRSSGPPSAAPLSEARAAYWFARCARSLLVLLEDEPQAVQRQPGLVVLDALGEAGEQAAQSAGGDHRRLAQLLFESLAETVNEDGGAEDDARLHGLGGGL